MRKKKAARETLDTVLNDIWKMLEQGASRFNDPFHWPVLGTRGEHGNSLRTVILRQLLRPERILVCYTDARAPKARQIRDFSKVSWLFYHPKKKIQLRISGQAELHADDEFAHERWANIRAPSRLDYNTKQPPGTPVDRPSSGLPDFLREKIPSLLDSGQGRANFMVISCRIEAIDWLRLKATGHCRARF
ncbi:MAG: pyridoxamine 5'-phosphate oxidase family protein, partial [Deltaproteobacteria bacterium]|nr:pyridoxamine 5'-phosphate oxidase family protein [Deltaproteobacteria bacterium]